MIGHFSPVRLCAVLTKECVQMQRSKITFVMMIGEDTAQTGLTLCQIPADPLSPRCLVMADLKVALPFIQPSPHQVQSAAHN
jgi:hypothetical protein